MAGWRFAGAPRYGIGWREEPQDEGNEGTPVCSSRQLSHGQKRPRSQERTYDGCSQDVKRSNLPDEYARQAWQVSPPALDPISQLNSTSSKSFSRRSSANAEDILATEVHRITSGDSTNYRRTLGFQPGDRIDLQTVQSKYRHLMRLLHPDKRTREEEIRAGGKNLCDEAVRLIQKAVESAKEDRLEDTRLDPVHKQDLKSPSHYEPPSNIGNLMQEVERVLAVEEPSDPRLRPDSTSADPRGARTSATVELINLLASLPRN